MLWPRLARNGWIGAGCDAMVGFKHDVHADPRFRTNYPPGFRRGGQAGVFSYGIQEFLYATHGGTLFLVSMARSERM
jgi:hypothetical protein